MNWAAHVLYCVKLKYISTQWIHGFRTMTFTNQFDFSVDPLAKVDLPKENDDLSKFLSGNKKRSSFNTPLSQAGMLRSPSISNQRRKSSVEARRASLSNIPISSQPESPSLTHEQLINQFEKEQDSIVMRLTKEISSLREENRNLKHMLSTRHERSPTIEYKKPLSRSSSLRSPTSRRASYGFGSHQGSLTSAESDPFRSKMKRDFMAPKDPSAVSVADIKAELDNKKENLRAKSNSPNSVSSAQVAI